MGIRAALTSLVMVMAMLTANVQGNASPISPPAVPRATCGPGAIPERGLQGRVTAEDIESGYASQGMRCNTELVSRFGEKGPLGGSAGGFKVFRYVDRAGHECAYYDSTIAVPLNLHRALGDGLGVYVLDMADPAHPVKTANLVTPAMLSPHESLSLNNERGLLAAVNGLGVLVGNPGALDVYDLTQDCRHPVLKSSTPLGVVGHEGTFSPDGKTFWASSGGGCNRTLTAVDVTNPSLPRIVWFSTDYRFHGLSLSNDGTRLYGADLQDPTGIPCYELARLTPFGLKILDVSQIQARVPLPKVSEVSALTWPTVSVPQATIPITIGGHPYLVEFDEFARGNKNGDPASPIGAARIIDLADDRHPYVVSDIRLEVHQPDNVATVADDPGARFSFAGYSPHYCSVPQRNDPGILACSFILSGLRVFDIRDPAKPMEIAYFNAPISPSNPVERRLNSFAPFNAAYAMSAPAFVPDRREIWYSDVNFGFFNVRVTNAAW